MKFNNKEFEKQLGYQANELIKLFKEFASARKPYENMWKLLNALDSGDFWKHIKAVLPRYSIRPDTNWITWVKENYVNTLYVGSYRGDVFCREYQYEQITLQINEFLEYIFNKLKFTQVQQQVGERAALLNFGALEIGWNSEVITGKLDELFSGEVALRAIDNLSLYLDPSVVDYNKGRAIFIAESINLIELEKYSNFSKRIKEYRELKKKDQTVTEIPKYPNSHDEDTSDETVRLLTCYYKHSDSTTGRVQIDKIWIIDDGFILNIKQDIKPNTFPIKVLYTDSPIKDPYGIPKTKKILNNAITLNLLDSIDSTMIFKSLERGKVISRRAGLNEPLFAKEGDSPNKLWVVEGDPNNVVRYVDLPSLPNDRHLLKQRLEQGIMRVTGIDDVYTGNDTNSIQTTGGMDLLNQRVSSRDNTRINNLQKFVLECTEYILKLYLNNSSKVSYSKYNEYHETEQTDEINFEDLRAKDIKFDFTCDVTPNIPNNILRRSEEMNIIMEKQMQYNFQPALISSEEWLQNQDFPNKYKILKRIRDERKRDDVEDIEAEIINYTGLVQQGVRPDKAIEMLASERQLKRDNPGLGNVGNSGTFQNKQAG